MADPVSLGLTAGASLIQGIGGLRAGKANARALEEQAWQEIRDGNAEEARLQEDARAQIGQQLAAQFGNGFQGGSGSALDALTQSQVNAALDALTIRRDAAARARSARAQASQARRQGRMALAEGLLGGAASAVNLNTDWAASRSRYQRVGAGAGG